MRLLVACATAAATVTLSPPAEAATAVYGFAWADGKGHLRIVPKSAARDSRVTYTLKSLPKAKELRLDHTRAAYGRVTVACDLKETEGRVAVDAKGLGRTACKPGHLAEQLGRGPVSVRVEYTGGRATRVNEILVGDWGTRARRAARSSASTTPPSCSPPAAGRSSWATRTRRPSTGPPRSAATAG
ncbi:hypothetical protein ACFQ0B_18810 [Nonomuraea thailandensis]